MGSNEGPHFKPEPPEPLRLSLTSASASSKIESSWWKKLVSENLAKRGGKARLCVHTAARNFGRRQENAVHNAKLREFDNGVSDWLGLADDLSAAGTKKTSTSLLIVSPVVVGNPCNVNVIVARLRSGELGRAAEYIGPSAFKKIENRPRRHQPACSYLVRE
jgi:hypothetical protein